jgi:hypothetical protein
MGSCCTRKPHPLNSWTAFSKDNFSKFVSNTIGFLLHIYGLNRAAIADHGHPLCLVPKSNGLFFLHYPKQ